MNKAALDLHKEGFDPKAGPHCPDCGMPSHLVPASRVYNSSNFGNIWLCSEGCDCYVGVHKRDPFQDYPLGQLADEYLRDAKIWAHYALDMLWKLKFMKRDEVYKWLQEKLELPSELAHIGEMNIEECYKTYNLAVVYIKEKVRIENQLKHSQLKLFL